MLGNMYVDKNGRKISDGDKVKINEECYRLDKKITPTKRIADAD